MSLTAVGSIAFDAVRTPFGERERMLGGSAVHFALAARFFTEVRIVGPTGSDFTDTEIGVLADRGVICEDIDRIDGGDTFFWRGHYDEDMNVAHTDATELGVFGEFEPTLSPAATRSDMLFLGNIVPAIQRHVRAQSEAPFVALDSMNLWIDTARDDLEKAISEVDCVLLNDAEIRSLTSESNLSLAASKLLALGPRAVVAKRGEYGAALFTPEGAYVLPGLLLSEVRDPTGAGDSFAGGFLGYLDGLGPDRIDAEALRVAMAVGTVIASFNVEDFGTERVQRLERSEIDARLDELAELTRFAALDRA